MKAVEKAFELLADGKFEDGLRHLNGCDLWHDDDDELTGPFFLGFPCRQGWGEALFVASLLKRHACSRNQKIPVYACPQVCSILKFDQSFVLHEWESDNSNQLPTGVRSPLAILKAALLGDLLSRPFKAVETDRNANTASHRSPKSIGTAWASISTKTVQEKSIPLENFFSILSGYSGEITSFQRKLGADERRKLNDWFGNRFQEMSQNELESKDQSDVVARIANLDCMVTVSTTTAHIAACLGLRTLLLAARRPGPQWFWRAQAEKSKCFYPSVQVFLGGEKKECWWVDCIDEARNFLAAPGSNLVTGN